MSEPTITLVIDVANIEFTPSIDGLTNVVTRIPYNWIATPAEGLPLVFPGAQVLGPADPDNFTDVTLILDDDLQDVLGGWVRLDLGRERIRQVKANMTAILAARETVTVKLFAPPEPEPVPPEEPLEPGPIDVPEPAGDEPPAE